MLDWRLTLLVDRDVDRVRHRLRHLKADVVTSALDDHLDAIDAAIVAVPNTLHVPICTTLLQKGKHVLVEKPIAMTMPECLAMLNAAQTGSARLAVMHWRRFRSVNIWTNALVNSGTLGDIQLFDVREGTVYGWPLATDASWRKESAGGGVLADMGPHTLDLLLWWLGDFDLVDYRDDSYGGVEADCLLQLTLQSGAKGVVELSRTRVLRNTAIIRGSKGWVEVSLSENAVLDGSPAALAFQHENLNPAAMPQQTIPSLFCDTYTDWLEAIHQDREPTVSGAEGTRSIALIETCYQRRRDWELPWVKGRGVNTISPQGGQFIHEGIKILVTGATGFIGGRRVERLILEKQAQVKAMVRNYSQAARLARFPLEMCKAELTDTEAIDRAVAGCAMVFHLAYDFSAPKKNLAGIRNLAKSCLQHGVKRFVHVSTAAVYGLLLEGDITEDSPSNSGGANYADTKLAVEQEILKYGSEHGLPVSVIQPTVVYGPFGGAFTISSVMRMVNGTLVLPNEGQGLCNAVYIDDVVDAILHAAECDNADGERFLISGRESCTWREFFGTYEKILGLDALKFLPEKDIRRQNRNVLAALQTLFEEPKRAILKFPALHKTLVDLYLLLPNRIGELALKVYFYKKAGVQAKEFLPDEQMIALCNNRGRVHIDKAQRILGYSPAFSLIDGMEMTAHYLR
jgi:predicted dehydrogenase/nucleoside-diphosphate-sugar epimerase